MTNKSQSLIVLTVVLFAGLWPGRQAIAQESINDIPDMPPLVQIEYPNVPETPTVQRLGREPLYVRIVNQTRVRSSISAPRHGTCPRPLRRGARKLASSIPFLLSRRA
jgi:hypothetical protein